MLQRGFIHRVRDEALEEPPILTTTCGGAGEAGLLGLAISPDSTCFYTYCTPQLRRILVARYTMPSQGEPVDAATEEVVFQFPRRPGGGNHNAGWIAFGPDGYLYIATGDNGAFDNSQDLTIPNGKILRIDVSRDDFPDDPLRNFAIPPDNPFADAPGLEPTIWHYGLRNPWRCSFDRETGDFWITDVGNGLREEINVLPAGTPGGVNFGWPCYEGAIPGPFGDDGCDPGAAPLIDFPHPFFRAIIGGYVYRGSAIPHLYGKYIFADLVNRIFTLERDGDSWKVRLLMRTDQAIYSISEAPDGELYVCTSFAAWKLVPDPCRDSISALLAAYGACAGDAAYNADADLNADGCVNLSDLAEALTIAPCGE
ncbi:MAG: PQQ-dependent sugar dehydrogenase [Phycisphaerales bacterium]|nr:PQQ-dependent sugar dehydrogenase [Phycisphaerales bacterium]